VCTIWQYIVGTYIYKINYRSLYIIYLIGCRRLQYIILKLYLLQLTFSQFIISAPFVLLQRPLVIEYLPRYIIVLVNHSYQSTWGFVEKKQTRRNFRFKQNRIGMAKSLLTYTTYIDVQLRLLLPEFRADGPLIRL